MPGMTTTTTSDYSLTDPNGALAFLLAGNAHFTLRSLKTGARYTYKVRRADVQPGESPLYFVALRDGSDYIYIGVIRVNGTPAFAVTRKSRMAADSLPVRGFRFAFDHLVRAMMPPNLEIWHEGRCGRCGRTLTVPESIESGFGPECINFVGR
jgi:Family of unknown function (DUF6011)